MSLLDRLLPPALLLRVLDWLPLNEAFLAQACLSKAFGGFVSREELILERLLNVSPQYRLHLENAKGEGTWASLAERCYRAGISLDSEDTRHQGDIIRPTVMKSACAITGAWANSSHAPIVTPTRVHANVPGPTAILGPGAIYVRGVWGLDWSLDLPCIMPGRYRIEWKIATARARVDAFLYRVKCWAEVNGEQVHSDTLLDNHGVQVFHNSLRYPEHRIPTVAEGQNWTPATTYVLCEIDVRSWEDKVRIGLRDYEGFLIPKKAGVILLSASLVPILSV